MKLRRILAISAAVVLVALVIWYRAKPAQPRTPIITSIMWKDRPESVEAAHRLADHVVLGQVVSVRHADDLGSQASGEPGGAGRIPVEMVTIKVEKTYKGGVAETIELFHTGWSDAPSPARRPPPPGPPPPKREGGVERSQAPPPFPAEDEVRTIMLDDDPGYTVGERYVLFVRKGPRLTMGGAAVETQAVVSPEGRHRVSKDNKLEPVTQRGFAGRLRGQALQQLEEEIARIPEGR